jgi:hypothetical protein
MAQIGLRDWFALLSEAGVKFSSDSGLRAAVESAARRLDVELAPEDLAGLTYMEDALGPFVRTRDFSRLVVCHIPQAEDVPHRDVPDDETTRSVRRGSEVTEVALSPWGRMEQKLETLISTAEVPIDWKPADGSNVTGKKWRKWRDGLVSVIDTMLWPVYQKGGASWSTPHVAKLFDADFALLLRLGEDLILPIDGFYPSRKVHNDFFKEEDDANIEFGTSYEQYDPTWPAHCLKGLTSVLIAGMADKVGTLDLQLKQVFQRPRAYQVALLQGRGDFAYRWARTGNTPSLVSGHCLQASLAGCTAYIAYRDEISADSIDVLRQFTVDVGDRRVFAGVHYPSDNLASWYVALNLAPLVFDGEHGIAARHFLWSAISRKSKVFAAINAQVAADPGSPYKKIVEEIKRLGSADR